MKDKVAEYILNEMKGLHSDYSMLSDIYFERSQLYGALINIMLRNGTMEAIVSYEELTSANKYVLKFTPDRENKTLKFELVPNVDEENTSE